MFSVFILFSEILVVFYISGPKSKILNLQWLHLSIIDQLQPTRAVYYSMRQEIANMFRILIVSP